MKLTKFRVQNYKTIHDSGWIRCHDVTAFVGKNEAGKTSLLRALSKLKSTDDAKYDAIKEFPHGRFTDEFKVKDWPVVEAEFLIDEDEKESLAEFTDNLAETKTVTVTKFYSGKNVVAFDPPCSGLITTHREWIQLVKDVIKVVESVLPKPSGSVDSGAVRTTQKQVEHSKESYPRHVPTTTGG